MFFLSLSLLSLLKNVFQTYHCVNLSESVYDAKSLYSPPPQARSSLHWIVIPYSFAVSLLDCELQESRDHVWLVLGGSQS